MPTDRSEEANKPKKRSSVFLFLRDAGVALLIVVLILVTMYAYTGLWPPLVVVESDSMMHGDENISHIGTIDTGDLVLVRKVDELSDVETYMDGFVSGHKTYGDFGDVVIYKRGGSEGQTPIIHRAIIYLEYDAAKGCYRSESLRDAPPTKWMTADSRNSWDNLTSTLRIFDVGWNSQTVLIDIAGMIPTQRSGFITKGDHNTNTDQMFGDGRPVELSWIVGKARGEIPWFGLLKLWTTGSLGSPAPENSVRNLWISILIIVVAPVLIDVGMTYREKRAIARRTARMEARAARSRTSRADEDSVDGASPSEEKEDSPDRLT